MMTKVGTTLWNGRDAKVRQGQGKVKARQGEAKAKAR